MSSHEVQELRRSLGIIELRRSSEALRRSSEVIELRRRSVAIDLRRSFRAEEELRRSYSAVRS